MRALKPFSGIGEVFQSSGVAIASFFIAKFRHCAIPGVMETQLMTQVFASLLDSPPLSPLFLLQRGVQVLQLLLQFVTELLLQKGKRTRRHLLYPHLFPTFPLRQPGGAQAATYVLTGRAEPLSVGDDHERRPQTRRVVAAVARVAQEDLQRGGHWPLVSMRVDGSLRVDQHTGLTSSGWFGRPQCLQGSSLGGRSSSEDVSESELRLSRLRLRLFLLRSTL